MVGIDLRQEQRAFISSMYQQGILDSHFDRVLSLQTRENPQFFVELTFMFLNDGENSMAKLDQYLKQPEIDYAQVSNYAQQLIGSSASIGVCQVSLACRELRFASDAMDKDRCFEAFVSLKNEYQTLKKNLNIIVEIERAIIANDIRVAIRQHRGLPP